MHNDNDDDDEEVVEDDDNMVTWLNSVHSGEQYGRKHPI